MTNTFPAALRGTGTRTGAGYDPMLRDGGTNINQPTITQAVANAALRDASRPFPLFGNINWSDSAGDSI